MKNKNDNQQNIEKGKELFYSYYGSRFGLYHDLGDEYEKCNVPKMIERKWRKDIIKILKNDIKNSVGMELHTAVIRYINLTSPGAFWLMDLLEERELDTYTALLFCRMIKDEYKVFKFETRSTNRFLEKYKNKLLSKPITVHESYLNSLNTKVDLSEEALKKAILEL